MSDAMLNILAAETSIHGLTSERFVDAVLAAQAAEPESMAELASALGRFVAVRSGQRILDDWAIGVSLDSTAAPVILFDMPARLLVHPAGWEPSGQGHAEYLDESSPASIWLPYHLSDDWLFVPETADWRAMAAERRRRRFAGPRLDPRPVLYEQVAEFLVDRWLQLEGDEDDPIALVHEAWLMTRRSDLGDRAPRDVMLDRHGYVMRDLQDQQIRWTMLKSPPPGLPRDSTAYRFAGFGTHEIILYYELIRALLSACWERIGGGHDAGREDEIAHLGQLKQEWMHTPQEELESNSPAQVIARERARLPMAVSAEHAMVDADCPCCQMMAGMPGPVFWHLDGCHMDEGFAFSLHRTYEEWESEQLKWQQWERSWQRDRLGPPEDAAE